MEPDEGAFADAELTLLSEVQDGTNHDPATEKKRTEISVQLFSETPELPIEWIWEGVIPKGMVSALGGKQGLGKSILLADIAARISIDKEMPDGTPCKQGKVLMFIREDDPNRVVRGRLEGAGADLSQIAWSEFTDKASDSPLEMAKDIDLAIEHAAPVKYELIIVDTYAAFAAADTDANNAQDVRQLLNALTRLAKKTGAAVLIIAHVRKNISLTSDPMDAFSGSAQMTAAVRVASILEQGLSTEEKRLKVVKNNLGPANTLGWIYRIMRHDEEGYLLKHPHLEWETAGEIYKAVDANIRERRATLDPEKVMDALVNAVASGPITLKLACHKVWEAMRPSAKGRVLQKHVEMTIEDLLNSEQEQVEVYEGDRRKKMVCLSGARPPAPEEMAYKIAELNPNIKVKDLAKTAKCRPETASAILNEVKAKLQVPTSDE